MPCVYGAGQVGIQGESCCCVWARSEMLSIICCLLAAWNKREWIVANCCCCSWRPNQTQEKDVCQTTNEKTQDDMLRERERERDLLDDT